MSEDTGSEDFHTVTSGSVNGGEAFTASVSAGIKLDAAALPSDNRSNYSPAPQAPNQSRPENNDLVRRIKGMYRALDLIAEQGSGGLVDKIIISQDGVQEFIDDIYPGAYTSLTRIDFKALDKLSIKPVGVYGSKSELVRFLTTLGSVDEDIAKQLLTEVDTIHGAEQGLRSGIYFVRSLIDPGNVFVMYWPEESTWDDTAISSVRRNRITFMRYLTKLADQMVVFISSAHANRLVWKEQTYADADTSSDEDESDRLFTFQVSKTVAQEESVTARAGFHINLPHGVALDSPPPPKEDTSLYQARLIPGEASLGLMVPMFRKQRVTTELWRPTVPMSAAMIRGALRNADQIVLSESLGTAAIRGLFECGLGERFPTFHTSWRSSQDALQQKYTAERKRMVDDEKSRLLAQHDQLQEAVRDSFVKSILLLYPLINAADVGGERYRDWGPQQAAAEAPEIIGHCGAEAQKVWRDHAQWDRLDPDFNKTKKRYLVVWRVLQERRDLPRAVRASLCDSILHGAYGSMEQILTDALATPEQKQGWLGTAKSFIQGPQLLFNRSPASMEAKALLVDAQDYEAHVSTPDFLASLEGLSNPEFAKARTDLEGKALRSLKHLLDDKTTKATRVFSRLLRDQAEHDIDQRLKAEHSRIERDYNLELLRGIGNASSIGEKRVFIESFEPLRPQYTYAYLRTDYYVDGRYEQQQRAEVLYTVYKFELSESDNQSINMDALHTPTPTVNVRQRHEFCLPQDQQIVFSQLLLGDRLLVVVCDSVSSQFKFYLDRLGAMSSAVRKDPTKKIWMQKTGPEILVACDETIRHLCLVSLTNLKLYAFVFDERFVNIHALGSEIDISAWYSPGTRLCHVAFVTGKEEVLLIDSSGLCRIFSLVTLQFKPATLELPSAPSALFSSPDGACFIVCLPSADGANLVAYHWATFEVSEGKNIPLPMFSVTNAVITSFTRRAAVHLVGLDPTSRSCMSMALSISQKSTEFMFSRRDKTALAATGVQTQHNSLLDCHSDVWTRFPVVSAIRRRTIDSSNRCGKALFVVSDLESDHAAYAPYFKHMIGDFERRTRKPTGRELDAIDVEASSYEHFVLSLSTSLWSAASTLHAGEWLVDLFCLIPIQLAICRDNQFCPMKDGVLSADFERSLLGADVNSIVDSLSFGWYESLFQSYLAAKPVKVVSSMGEQSVGKSFALNHLVDTSFAGSAMRTTEGVWMSITPTDDALIVALDFEGVHSIERSAQEDALLVLFNTALSNLVLFRNNFSLSRDITGLFQSFQSSSSVLDPEANPHLFQSTLAIVIRDVTDTDKDEIYKEFSLKFERIVHEERDANFISKLHSGKLDIIPWPVIESKQFYKMFFVLKKRLDQQNTAHASAGGFLLTMKTLMAKLKANDWGAMSQTLASHRVKTLHTLLDRALRSGVAELEPDVEPLKNLDTDTVIDCPDSSAHFFVVSAETDPRQRDDVLDVLRQSWACYTQRQAMPDGEFFAGLTKYLTELVDMRIEHVRQWVDENLARFHNGHDSIDGLRRLLDAAVIDMKASTQLCGFQCQSCGLLCVLGRLHEENSSHDCLTSHECAHQCSYCTAGESGSEPPKACGMKAGHSGRHICAVDDHLCGEPCKLSGAKGCLAKCMKVPGHDEDEHVCSAALHKCGKACALAGVRQTNGKPYSCSGTCDMPHDVDHVEHACDTRQCPFTCQLCNRFCSSPHLHGLADNKHLCGEQHKCKAMCSAGICQIDTAPHSVDATFTGRNETFQYTKYTQLSKQSACCKTIERGELGHDGPHVHGLDKDLFHYCNSRCNDCGYYCTLPHGHPQAQHETSHGSMSRTRWAVIGEDGTSIEVNGRKFSANDEGAPMLCNMVCLSLGRHIHVDYCRSTDGSPCNTAEIEHITSEMRPNPEREKDAITHALYWRRSGFKDPYPQEHQTTFAKCDAMCPDTEHSDMTASGDRQPSYCTLPMFHAPATNAVITASAASSSSSSPVANAQGYISSDGHAFSCNNPATLHPAYHVIFVIDKSGSMTGTDRRPVPNTPVTAEIVRVCDNRLGAVCSALHAFWTARQASSQRASAAIRRDAYSVVLFDDTATHSVVHDVSSSPADLLRIILQGPFYGGTDFNLALESTRALMEQNWSAERKPVVIFLSDGEDHVDEGIVRNLCQSAIRLGEPLSFHAVSFGSAGSAPNLRIMADIALEVQDRATQAQGPGLRRNAVPSSYSAALTSITLAETFLGIASAITKPRGSLLR